MRRVQKKPAGFLTALFLFLVCSLSVQAAEEKTVNEEKTVKVAYYPVACYNENVKEGEPWGLDVEYMQHLGTYCDWNIEYIYASDWNQAMQLLSDHEVDLLGQTVQSPVRERNLFYPECASGYTFGVIMVKDTCDVAYEDFEAFETMKFGMLSDFVNKEDFYSYLRRNGINPKIEEYKDMPSLRSALADGRIDAAVHMVMEVGKGERIVGKFSPMPYYFVTYKGNPIAQELNLAVESLQLAEPELEDRLMKKYCYDQLNQRVVLTADQRAYLEENPVWTAVYVPDFYPYSYETKGAYAGISRNVLDELAERAGFRFTYKRADTMEEAMVMLRRGEADVLGYCLANDDWITSGTVRMAGVYLESPVALIQNGDTLTEETKTGEFGKFAVVKSNGMLKNMLLSNNLSVLECEDQRDCFEAIRKGKAEYTVCSSYLGEAMIREARYKGFTSKLVTDEQQQIGLAYSGEASQQLAGILSSGLRSFNEEDMNDYVMASLAQNQFSIGEWLKENAVWLLCGLILIALLIILLLSKSILDSRKVQKLLYADPATGIWNYSYFSLKVNEFLEKKRDEGLYAVFHTNIPRFRYINDLYGRENGDEILRMISNVLGEEMKGHNEMLARNSADHFVGIIRVRDREETTKRLVSLCDEISRRVKEDSDFNLVMTMGVYILTPEDKKVSVAVEKAGHAMAVLKNNTHNAVNFYDEEFTRSVAEQQAVEQLLEESRKRENFLVYYQAKVNVVTEKVVGAEALVRFKHPLKDKIMAPSYFLPYYERTGFITQIDFIVLDRVCAMIRRRLDEGEEVVPVSCNFSRRHFDDPEFERKLEDILDYYDVDKKYIEVEITETVMMENMQSMIESLSRLHELGFKISIDDFGAGYSSLGLLENIPADVIKIDRSFLENDANQEKRYLILESIVKLAQSLNMKLVFEGVENMEHVNLLKKIESYVAQGFYYARPVPELQFEERLNHNEGMQIDETEAGKMA